MELNYMNYVLDKRLANKIQSIQNLFKGWGKGLNVKAEVDASEYTILISDNDKGYKPHDPPEDESKFFQS